MTEELTYNEISKKRRGEEVKDDLVELDENFYLSLSDYLQNKIERFKEKQEKSPSKMADKITRKIKKEIKNARKMARDIYDKRENKIVLRALTDARRETKIDDTSSMLPQEENLYFQIKETLEKYRENLLKYILFGEYGRRDKGTDKKLIQFGEKVPKFVWKNNKKYGPFEKKSIANLPEELASFLIEKGKANEVKENETST